MGIDLQQVHRRLPSLREHLREVVDAEYWFRPGRVRQHVFPAGRAPLACTGTGKLEGGLQFGSRMRAHRMSKLGSQPFGFFGSCDRFGCFRYSMLDPSGAAHGFCTGFGLNVWIHHVFVVGSIAAGASSAEGPPESGSVDFQTTGLAEYQADSLPPSRSSSRAAGRQSPQPPLAGQESDRSWVGRIGRFFFIACDR